MVGTLESGLVNRVAAPGTAMLDAAAALPTTDRASPTDPESASRVGRDLESVFLRMLLKEMLPRDAGAFFGKQAGAETYRDLFVGAIADRMAERGVLGIRELVEKQIGAKDPHQAGVVDVQA